MLILLAGLPGTGKSHLARALASTLGVDILDRDAIRDAIFPAHDLDYSPEQNELASQTTYAVATYILQRDLDRILILDGRPFSKRAQVDKVVELAWQVNHPLRVIFCWAPDDVVRRRLDADLHRTGNLAADRTINKYLRIKRTFEPLVVDHLSLNTDQPTEALIKRAVGYLELSNPSSP